MFCLHLRCTFDAQTKLIMMHRRSLGASRKGVWDKHFTCRGGMCDIFDSKEEKQNTIKDCAKQKKSKHTKGATRHCNILYVPFLLLRVPVPLSRPPCSFCASLIFCAPKVVLCFAPRVVLCFAPEVHIEDFKKASKTSEIKDFKEDLKKASKNNYYDQRS